MAPERGENSLEAHKDWHPGGTSGNGGAKEVPASLQKPEEAETPAELADEKVEIAPAPEKTPNAEASKEAVNDLIRRLQELPDGERGLIVKAAFDPKLDDMTRQRTLRAWEASKYPEMADLARKLRENGPQVKGWLAGRRAEQTAEEPATTDQDKSDLETAVKNLKARGEIQESEETRETPTDYTELKGRYSWQEGLQKAKELYGPDARYPNGEEAQQLLAAELAALVIGQAIGAYLDGGEEKAEGEYVLFLKTKDGIREIPHTATNNMEPHHKNADASGSAVEIKKIVIPGAAEQKEESAARLAA